MNKNTMTFFNNNILSKKPLIKAVMAILIILFSILVFSSPASSDDTILVAVSILPQQEFVENIAGEIEISTLVMIPPGANPATHELTPSQMKKLSRVRIYFKIGTHLPFEQVWLDKIANLNPNMLIVDCSKSVDIPNDAEEPEHTEHQHSHHHGHDPHIWSSPANARIMVQNMADGFIAIDPEHKSDYEKNTASYIQKLDELNLEIINLFENKTSRKFIIFHPAWGHFAREYDLIQIPIEIEGKEPGAGDLIKLVSLAKEEGLSTVFASPQFNAESAGIIASEIGGTVEFIDPLRKDYINNMRETASKLAGAMK